MYVVSDAINIQFLPDGVCIAARPGELLLDCAARAGLRIPTGCLMGSCHACEVEIEGQGPVCACITTVHARHDLTVHLYTDPVW